MAKIYDNPYQVPSVYNNAVELLQMYLKEGTQGIHLDIGCGFGPIAEPIATKVGLNYVGFDLAEDGLESLAARGMETHKLDLSDVKKSKATIRKAVGTRSICSITVLDTLEHLSNPENVLEMLRELTKLPETILVISVPNITHKDIAVKALSGRWDVTESGILDHTHRYAFGEAELNRLVVRSGWQQIGARDWRLELSDQHFPANMPTLDSATPVGHLLRNVGEWTNPNLLTNQFVRAYRCTQPRDVGFIQREAEAPNYYFTLAVDFRKLAPGILEQLFKALVLQTNQNFEILAFVERPQFELVNRLKQSFGDRLTITYSQDRYDDCLNERVRVLRGRYLLACGSSLVANSRWLELLEGSSPSNLVIKAVKHGKDPAHTTPFTLIDPDSILLQHRFALPVNALQQLSIAMTDPNGHGLSIAISKAINLCGLIEVEVEDLLDVNPWEPPSNEYMSEFHHLLSYMNNNPQILPVGGAVKIEMLQNAMGAARVAAATWTPPQIAELLRKYNLPELPQKEKVQRPFLTIVTRTTGSRNIPLRETLMSLAAQTCTDFIVIVVLHSTDAIVKDEVQKILDEMPSGFRDQLSLLVCGRPGRSSPLNDALPHVVSAYLAVLDDDDFVFAHWVETFKNSAEATPGKMLRVRCVRQDFEMDDEQRKVPRAVSWFKTDWPATYNATMHLYANYTPFMSVAIPIEAFTLLGIRWDESLSTTEDWHLMTRVAILFGVSASPEITCVYRWWIKSESSAFLHAPIEWEQNRQKIIDMYNSQTVILPPGAAREICDLIDARTELHRLIGMSNRELLAERVWQSDRTRPDTRLGKAIKLLKRFGKWN